MQQPSVSDRPKGQAARHRFWPWWLRSPHSRLFSEWIEYKTDQHDDHPGAASDTHTSAA